MPRAMAASSGAAVSARITPARARRCTSNDSATSRSSCPVRTPPRAALVTDSLVSTEARSDTSPTSSSSRRPSSVSR